VKLHASARKHFRRDRLSDSGVLCAAQESTFRATVSSAVGQMIR